MDSETSTTETGHGPIYEALKKYAKDLLLRRRQVARYDGLLEKYKDKFEKIRRERHNARRRD